MIRKMFQLFTGLVGFIHTRLKCTVPFLHNTLVPLKQSAMNSPTIQQEVMVFMQTSFVQKILMENISNDKKSYPAEQLEKAFLNGMLNQLLMDFMPHPGQQQRSETAIWQIRTSECSLLINRAEAPGIIQYSCSISPFVVLSTATMN